MIHKNGESIVSDKEHIERKLHNECKAKPSTNDKVLPDSIDLTEGMVGQKASIKYCPKCI